MSGQDRRRYLTETVLDQEFLNWSADCLENRLEMILDIETPEIAGTYTNPSANLVEVTKSGHPFLVGNYVTITSAADSGLVGVWEVTARTSSTFTFNKGSAVSPSSGAIGYTEMIRASDRNKYTGATFYEALLKFPVITRTVGEWLTPELQFSTLTVELSNVDERFNRYLPAGADFTAWIGKSIEVKLGLAESAGTYTRIFKGRVTDVGGAKRSVKSITFIARDDYDTLNVNFPKTALTKTSYPNLEDANVGKVLPVIYGDFTVALDPSPAIIPAFLLNGADPNVAGGSFNNLELVVAEHDLTFFDTSNVWLKRGDTYFQVPAADVVNVVNNNFFEIDQNTANLWVDGAAYTFESGDEFLVQVKGKDLGAYDDNIVAQAKDILITQAGVSSGDFDSNWDTYRDKAAPAESAISSIKSRVWENEPKPVMTYALSLLEQVRLEAYIDRSSKLKLNSLHFEDWQPSPSFTLKNWDVVEGSFQPTLDERNNFNRARGVYDFHPDFNENARATPIFKNQASIDQINGRAISKQISFPQLYISTDVESQLKEILKLASSLFETVVTGLTWRSMLLELGDFVKIDVKIGSSNFDNVPAMIREIGYDPNGLQIPVKLWSFQLVPFSGYAPGYAGTVGGSTATITQE